jgi:hypothetical protein
MRQMIFYAMCEAELFDPALSERSLLDIRSKGFDAIYLEYRNTAAAWTAPRFRAGVTRICAISARIGLSVVLDASLNHLHAWFKEHHPEAYTDHLQPQRLALTGGRFVHTTSHVIREHRPLLQVWRIGGSPQAAVLTDLTDQVRFVVAEAEGGGCAMTEARGGMITRSTFAIDGEADGELLVIERRLFESSFRDLGHPALSQAIGTLLDWAASLPIAGIVWDEPHFGFAFFEGGRPFSDRLAGVFRSRFGYDLLPRLPELWLDVAGRDSAQVRLDFAELLESQLEVLERDFHDQALAHPGLGGRDPRFTVGIHRTMHEELSDDFHIGCIDYFRHNRWTTSGYTDSVFERRDSMVAMGHLARSLGRVSTHGEAWNNSWGFRPTSGHLAEYLPLYGALGVRWLGHAYHGSWMFGPGYPHHPTWADMPERLAEHGGLLDRLDGAVADIDTLVVFHWRGLATYPDNYLHTHRRTITFLALQLTDAGVQFHFTDERILAAGRAPPRPAGARPAARRPANLARAPVL